MDIINSNQASDKETTESQNESSHNNVDENTIVSSENITLEVMGDGTTGKEVKEMKKDMPFTKTTMSEKIAGVLADGWKTRVTEARQLIVDEITEITYDDISTDEKFITALEDGSLLCKLAQSLSDKFGLNKK